MGNQNNKATNSNDVVENELVQAPTAISYQDAVNLLSDYLKDLTDNLNDGKSDIVNKIEETVTKLLSQALNFPPFVYYEQEDQELLEKIQSLGWITPKDLGSKLELQDLATLSSVSDAVHALAVMTTRGNAFEMLSCVVDCCKYTMQAVQKTGNGADDLLPGIIYVVLRSNPPKLYSHLKFISSFLEKNEKSLNNSHRISNAVPRLFGTIMDCCFTNIQVAVTTVKNIEAMEETKKLKYGRSQLDYLEGQYMDAVNNDFEKELATSFKELEDGLNRLINVRKEIRDRHRDDMLAIADKLDGNKKKTHVTKAVGLFASIGGGIISIVGFGLMFTTFGASAVLIPLGASLGGAGGLTASISGFVEYGIKRSTAKDIKQMRGEYEEVVNEVFKSLQKIEETINNVWSWFQIAGRTGKSVIVIVDIVVKLARLAVAIDNVSDIGVTAFRAAGAAGRGLAIAGVVFSAILLPIDLIFFGISVKKLKDDEKSKQADEIRAWLDQDLPDEEQISKIVNKLKNSLLDFVKSIRTKSSSNSGDTSGVIEESEELLKQTLEEVKSMIENEVT